MFAVTAGAPRAAGEPPALPRVESWITAACGGTLPCERWAWAQRLAEILEGRLALDGDDERVRLATAIAEEAELARLDPLLVLAMIEVESGFDAEAVSRQGATGLMQLKPATLLREAERARFEVEDPDDPVLNVRAGVRYYRRLLDAYRGDSEVALMAYNAGPQRISRLRREEGGIPERYRGYPRRVQAEWRRLRGEAARVALADGAAPQEALR